VEAGVTISIYCDVSGDENDAMEAGITKVVTATYPVMKMRRISLQWKREELK